MVSRYKLDLVSDKDNLTSSVRLNVFLGDVLTLIIKKTVRVSSPGHTTHVDLCNWLHFLNALRSLFRTGKALRGRKKRLPFDRDGRLNVALFLVTLLLLRALASVSNDALNRFMGFFLSPDQFFCLLLFLSLFIRHLSKELLLLLHSRSGLCR
jgi:hypothetical protein